MGAVAGMGVVADMAVGVVAGTEGSAGSMVLPTVAGPTWVMGGAAMH